MPLLAATDYPPLPALGLVTTAGLPGVLLMPALPLILYAIVARVSIEDMFLGGALPAALMVLVIAAWAVWRQPPRRTPPRPFDRARARRDREQMGVSARPVTEVFRAVAPLFIALAPGVLIITYVPWLSTFLPALRA